MVLQVPRRVRAKIPQALDLRAAAQGHREDPAGAVCAARGRARRRARDAGPRASAAEHPAEVQRLEHGGLREGEVGHPDPPAVSGTGAELHGVPLLGAGLLREHRRPRRAEDPRVHPGSRGGGKATGTAAVRGASARFTRQTGSVAPFITRGPPRGAFVKPPALRVVADYSLNSKVARMPAEMVCHATLIDPVDIPSRTICSYWPLGTIADSSSI
jgi:hypothetical protein